MSVNLKNYSKKMFEDKEIMFTNSARSSLQALVEDFNLKNSAMAIQSFICSDFFSPFLIQNNIHPILLDFSGDSINVSLSEIKKKYKLNKKIKSVLIVHSLGQANQEIESISKWCREKKIILIEDSVYSLGAKINGKYLGTFGDAAVFSFFKSLNIFLGSLYLKNRGKIAVTAKSYHINRLDLMRFIKMFKFGDKLIRILRPVKKNLGVQIVPSRTEILSLPWYANYFYVSSRKIDLAQRMRVSKYLFNLLRKEIKSKEILPPVREEGNFSYSLILFVKNREEVYSNLIRAGVPCDKRWDFSLDRDAKLAEKWPLYKTPRAREISRQIINILINPNYSESYMRKLSKKISSIVLESGV
jgi:dTDP-4-amino-4,6-dideoxygalactose transaminase